MIVWIPIDRRHQASTPSKIQARAGDLDRSSPPVVCRVRRKADYRPETNLTPFATIRARAVERKGGTRMLTTLLPRVATRAELTALPDDRILSEMTKRIFCSGCAGAAGRVLRGWHRD